MFKKYVFSLLFLISASTCTYAADGQDYLEDARYVVKSIAIGEGAAYGNYDESFLTVDVNPAVRPDIVQDIRQPGQLERLPDESFQRIVLRNVDIAIFNSSLDNGVPLRGLEDTTIPFFGNIARILQQGGTLEFNNMWGGIPAHPQVVDSQREAAARGFLNPFNQYLLPEDIEALQSQRFIGSPVFDAYSNQLRTFFSQFGFTIIELVQEGPSINDQPKPVNASSYVTPNFWWRVTK